MRAKVPTGNLQTNSLPMEMALAARLGRLLKKGFFAPFPESLELRLRFARQHGFLPDLRNPRTLTEKIFWLKLFDRTPLRAIVSDREQVRGHVLRHASGLQLPAQLWRGDQLTKEVWNSLPRRFVLKASHGSHMTALVDKQRDDHSVLHKLSQFWLGYDYAREAGEWVYAEIPHYLIAEEMLCDQGKPPADWKFFCGNGRIFMMQLHVDRFGDYRRCFCHPDLTPISGVRGLLPGGGPIARPANYAAVCDMVEKLAAPFDFIRVDLYLIGEQAYFGEMTCFPGGGWERIRPRSLDLQLGAHVRLAGPGG
ncbi:ATP-grasp fold amidoligase family protein [Derxia gummosa]|uniref:ATP-grasp fold amidoligase family protein n=1 Tax=Derxia gummosa DSM 723 TaxID=1121388 RepID=A0A8B6X2F1_9BURK|nr:ATP-grasp fold amidoligase family protein [Derxia gummosa]